MENRGGGTEKSDYGGKARKRNGLNSGRDPLSPPPLEFYAEVLFSSASPFVAMLHATLKRDIRAASRFMSRRAEILNAGSLYARKQAKLYVYLSNDIPVSF